MRYGDEEEDVAHTENEQFSFFTLAFNNHVFPTATEVMYCFYMIIFVLLHYSTTRTGSETQSPNTVFTFRIGNDI